MARDPLPILLAAYERYGPVFAIRALHGAQVFALGPAANHHILVANAGNYLWRDGEMSDFIPLLGDGLLTIDGERHRRMRRIVLPAFHRESIGRASEAMLDEAERAVGLWEPGQVVDVHNWARNVAMRIAMRSLLGIDPDDDDTGVIAAREFERALAFYGTDHAARLSREPGSPLLRFEAARDELDRILYGEIASRRRTAGREGGDILGMLLRATDEDGHALTDSEVRDQMITLMFAGHDTTASTLSFLLYELARQPEEYTAIRAEQREILGGRSPGLPELAGGMPRLEMALDETLRLYPPAWVGPRRTAEEDEIEGVPIPAGARVNYSSWATHRLPEVFPEPERFVPERFRADRKAALPKGAYVPFGGGSRTCIGMRFGQLEIRVLATVVLQRFRLELPHGHRMTVRPMPTLRPEGALPMRICAAC
jgi:cytochrome P450